MSGPEERDAVFDPSRQCFEEMLVWLEGQATTTVTHAELEDELDRRGRELLRRMLQNHLSLRAANEDRLASVPTPTLSPMERSKPATFGP